MRTAPPSTSRIDPRMRLLAWMLDRVGPRVGRMTPEQIRRERAQRVPDNLLANLLFGTPAPEVAVTDLRVPAPGWDMPVRVYRPRGPRRLPVVVFFHGGGWVLGNVTQARWLCTHVAARVGAVVFAVGYRQAPEHRFPVAVEDAYAGLRWVVDHAAEHGGDAGRLAVMGASAGGTWLR